MLLALTRSLRSRIWFGILPALFLFSTFPGKGGLEGDQRHIALLSERTDHWGFIVPFVFGSWPNILGHWRFSLVTLQLILLWVGQWLLLRRTWRNNRQSRLYISILVFFSSVFASQLWRDATLFALACIALGLLSFSLENKGSKRVMLLFLSILLLHAAAMFKVLYGFILGLLYATVLIHRDFKRKKSLILSLVIVASLSISPFFVDKKLSSLVGLQHEYPEQQPLIFDLASNYCWGQSEQIIGRAASGLEVVLKPGFPLPAVCASLKPNSWDNLHASPYKWNFGSPISKISGDDAEKMYRLRGKWLSMVIHNPVDWIQTRTMFLGWTLILSNSLVPQNSTNTWGGITGKINAFMWTIMYSVASLMDKLRLSSILFAFGVVFFLLFRNAFLARGSRVLFLDKSISLFSSLFVLSSLTFLTLLGYVASNGRYVLPYILLMYLLLMRSLNLRSPIQV